MTKPFNISKQQVVEAYKLVKTNAGSAGVDQQSLEDFARNLKDNLYKIWNRMSSGCYFPPPVKAVPIPKKSGGERILGVPTVSDRIAQMVVKLTFEPMVEPYFLPDSYGYRPNKSALDAVGITRQRCWKYDWVLEFDIKGMFDNIDHSLLMKAVHKHTDCKWVLLYIERWLHSPMQLPDGSEVARNAGVPQGGVISPLLSNLFMHYTFDKWMQNHYSTIPWCRYADDGLLHCKTEHQAKLMLEVLTQRFKECGLQLHPDKTRIIYCKDDKRKSQYENISFDFLGYTFKPRRVKIEKNNICFIGFNPAVSKNAMQSMRDETRQYKWHLRTEHSLEEIAEKFNPVLQGWLNYYGRYYRSELETVWRHFNKVLVKWASKKYKRFGRNKLKAARYMEQTFKARPKLFAHWKAGMGTAFA